MLSMLSLSILFVSVLYMCISMEHQGKKRSSATTYNDSKGVSEGKQRPEKRSERRSEEEAVKMTTKRSVKRSEKEAGKRTIKRSVKGSDKRSVKKYEKRWYLPLELFKSIQQSQSGGGRFANWATNWVRTCRNGSCDVVETAAATNGTATQETVAATNGTEATHMTGTSEATNGTEATNEERQQIINDIRKKCRNNETEEFSYMDWSEMSLGELRSIVIYGDKRNQDGKILRECALPLNLANWLEKSNCHLKPVIGNLHSDNETKLIATQTKETVNKLKRRLGDKYPDMYHYWIKHSIIVHPSTNRLHDNISVIRIRRESINQSYDAVIPEIGGESINQSYDAVIPEVGVLVAQLLPELFISCSLIAPLVTALFRSKIVKIQGILEDVVNQVNKENSCRKYKLFVTITGDEYTNTPKLLTVLLQDDETDKERKILYGDTGIILELPNDLYLSRNQAFLLNTKVFSYREIESLRLELYPATIIEKYISLTDEELNTKKKKS